MSGAQEVIFAADEHLMAASPWRRVGGRLHTAWLTVNGRPQVVLAPALPSLVLLAVTAAGMVDPPQAGLQFQLHVPMPVPNPAVTDMPDPFATLPKAPARH